MEEQIIYPVITSQVESVTPEVAANYLKMNLHNRPLNKGQVRFYSAQMQRGEWELNGEALIFADNGELLDGQTRLHAVIASGVTIQTVVVRGIKKDAFKTIDTARARTPGDILAIAGIKNATTVASFIQKYWMLHIGLHTALSNAGIASRSGQENRLTKAGILSFYGTWANQCQRVFTLQEACRKLPLLTGAEVGGVALFLHLDKGHDLTKIEDFFRGLLFDDVCPNITLAKMRTILIRDKTSAKRMTGKHRQCLLAKTWNAYCNGKDLKVIYWNEDKEGTIEFI